MEPPDEIKHLFEQHLKNNYLTYSMDKQVEETRSIYYESSQDSHSSDSDWSDSLASLSSLDEESEEHSQESSQESV